ncbi:MAG: hypothetical protein IPK56_11275 [Elusimicrobia bacterium]|nr:hypothetical protein [Elusimicrobiota bacterium]
MISTGTPSGVGPLRPGDRVKFARRKSGADEPGVAVIGHVWRGFWNLWAVTFDRRRRTTPFTSGLVLVGC